jgi:uncharacterized protein (DUF433 family)
MNRLAQAPDLLARNTVEPGKRSGQPCIRGYRLTVKDVLEYLAGGMSAEQVLEEFPELEKEDLLAVYAYAAQELNRAA